MNKWGDWRLTNKRNGGRENFDVLEKDTGVYVQFDWNTELFGRPFRGNAGTRIAITDVTSNGSTPGGRAIVGSSGTVSYDPGDNAMVFSIRLTGFLNTASGSATSATDLGSFTGRAVVDANRGSYQGQLDGVDRLSLFSSIGGWLFGPSEAAAAFEILAADPAQGGRMSVVGRVVAAR